jgi:hypothetical protein
VEISWMLCVCFCSDVLNLLDVIQRGAMLDKSKE